MVNAAMAARGQQGARKLHETPQGAYQCYARYLLAHGYKQIGRREFEPVEGGPILVLTKKSKFGGMMRRGKSDKAKNRVVAGGHHQGVIV